MPRIVTLEERRRNEIIKFNRSQDNGLRCDLRDAKKDIGYTFEELTKKTDFSINTVQKVFNDPDKATLAQLRTVCNALGLRLTVCTE